MVVVVVIAVFVVFIVIFVIVFVNVFVVVVVYHPSSLAFKFGQQSTVIFYSIYCMLNAVRVCYICYIVCCMLYTVTVRCMPSKMTAGCILTVCSHVYKYTRMFKNWIAC